MSAIRFDGVTRRYGRTVALDAVDLAVERGRFTVLAGPPRAGKSAMLRILVGLETPDAGRVLIDGTDVTGLPPVARGVGYVPQSFALVPHLSVRDNIAYPLRRRGVGEAEINRRLAPIAAMLQIAPLLGQRPSALSGGQKQRAAIARGVLGDASVFVLDDPLVGLDFKLRESLMDELRDMQESLGKTFLYATSDPLEALALAQDLAVLDAGQLIEAGPVARLYREPGRLRTAELTGFPRCNVLAGVVRHGWCETRLGRVAAPGALAGPVSLALRPEHVSLDAVGDADGAAPLPARDAGTLRVTGRLRIVENLGAECVLHLDCGGTDGTTVALVAVQSSASAAARVPGDHLVVTIRAGTFLFFDGGGRACPAGGSPAHA